MLETWQLSRRTSSSWTEKTRSLSKKRRYVPLLRDITFQSSKTMVQYYMSGVALVSDIVFCLLKDMARNTGSSPSEGGQQGSRNGSLGSRAVR